MFVVSMVSLMTLVSCAVASEPAPSTSEADSGTLAELRRPSDGRRPRLPALPQVPPAAPSSSTTSTTTTQPPTPPVESVQRDTHVLYSSPVDGGTYQIHRKALDGTGRVALTADTTVEHHWPRPSPDGSTILFYTAAPGKGVNDTETNSLWAMNSDGSARRQLIPDNANGWDRQGHVEWSPDGERLVMAAGTSSTMDIFVTDAQGRNPQKVTDRGSHMAIDPSWSPDGESLLFIGCDRTLPTCLWWDYEVFRLDLSTGIETRLSFDTAPDFDPYYSPDGSTIAWLRCVGSFPFGPWSIYRSPAVAPLQPQSVVDDGNINSNIDFSSDGDDVVFSRHVIGLTTWMSAARARLDGTEMSFLGGAPADRNEEGVVYWP